MRKSRLSHRRHLLGRPGHSIPSRAISPPMPPPPCGMPCGTSMIVRCATTGITITTSTSPRTLPLLPNGWSSACPQELPPSLTRQPPGNPCVVWNRPRSPRRPACAKSPKASPTFDLQPSTFDFKTFDLPTLPVSATVHLQVQLPNGTSRAFELTEHDTFLLGRMADCHLCLPDAAQVSRQQFLLEACPSQASLPSSPNSCTRTSSASSTAARTRAPTSSSWNTATAARSRP